MIDPAPSQPVHNLDVAGEHTFLVGKKGLSCTIPTSSSRSWPFDREPVLTSSPLPWTSRPAPWNLRLRRASPEVSGESQIPNSRKKISCFNFEFAIPADPGPGGSIDQARPIERGTSSGRVQPLPVGADVDAVLEQEVQAAAGQVTLEPDAVVGIGAVVDLGVLGQVGQDPAILDARLDLGLEGPVAQGLADGRLEPVEPLALCAR